MKNTETIAGQSGAKFSYRTLKSLGLQALLILVGGFLAHQFLPFWATALVAGLVGLLFRYENSAVSFAAGFAAATLLWSGFATFLNVNNEGLLAGQMGQLFKMSSTNLIYLTGLVGGLLGGLGALTGALARKMFEKQATQEG